MLLRFLALVLVASALGQSQAAETLFDKSNLAAWCIVPFDAGKRGPEERAAMLEKMGVKKFVYDYRKEHIPQWDEELNALKKHHIELMGWWFPTVLNDEAKQTLELFKRHGVHPQLWVNGNGGAIQVKDEADQQARVAKEVERLQPICEAAAPLGCQVALYNHGGWYGEPENAIAIVEALKAKGIKNIGIVYNLHHGHGHLDRLAKVLPRMLPHLLCFNLNGMDIDGEAKGRKILPLGVGTEDVKVLRIVRASGYNGPIGILNHTNEDAEGRLLDNLDGLAWLLPQLDDNPPGPKPKYRTWNEKPAAASIITKPVMTGESVPSLSIEFGEALKGSYFESDNEPFRTLPLTIECRAKLTGKDHFNILIASDAKSSATHWELYTHAKRGTLALYMPGRGGDFDSKVDVCDGKWHDFVVNIDEQNVTLWIDGKQVFTKAVQPLKGTPTAGGIAFGSLVDGGIGCDGLLDDVRLTRGVMKPRKGSAPRLRMDNTIGLWDFDNLDALLPPPAPKPVAFTPDHKPLNPDDNVHWQEFVNRERIFDFYGKQALQFMKQKPLPVLIPQFPGLDGGQQGHWGNQNDQVTWKDGRFAASDHGPVFSGVFKGAGLTIPKAVCVQYGDMSCVFDPETLSIPVTWTGGFIKLGDARHGFMGGAAMNGKVMAKSQTKRDGLYQGYYISGRRVVFVFEKDGATDHVIASGDPKDLVAITASGPAQWPQWIETKGKLGTQQPFATDTIEIPFKNPYGALFFITAHDFFSDGTAAIATMTGEVWLVKGIDEKLEKIRWKRFATGLNQPLGMKIVKDKLYVLGRDQITCLHDLNGDDEADFYQCVTNAMQTSPGGHDFIVGLETDKEGRWYFASGNQGVCRITGRDKLEVLGTGFRNPNGLGISPDGRFLTTSVQEGDWTPATSICQIELDHNLGAHFGAGGPKNGQSPEPVLMYMPRGEDNSASSQAFITSEKWTTLKGDGNFVHLSSGGGSAWLVMRQNVKGRWQAGAVKISGNFDSGPQCARFNPKDGHLYVNGMQGWGSYTPKDGCFQRVRFTGGEKPVPVGFEARDNGVLLRFNQPVANADAATCFAQCWNYRYGPQYGSPEYSVKYADTPGHDPLEVRSVHKLDGGKTLFLEIPQIVTASQIHLHVSTGHDIFLTAHALAEPFSEFPGYAKIAKTNHAAQIGLEAPKPAKLNPWAKGEGGRELIIEAALGLQYVQKQLTAKADEKLTIIFKNPDVVPHNWMLAKPGTLQKIGNLANLMITDPQGLAKHYVPDSDDVLAYTDMTNPKGEFTIHITAPKEKGDYPYLCTFPGHWMVMNGVLKVE
ncbi:LamG-like jellyroll fold domain-containing protein [Prosthecobacter sp.]|uniref:LamG-like jellyroll fold domain-containing protein n=1 Tax=Prosthecobacter sp. TaxID=1965333 RepID=UPI002486CED4|nr:LamG-like jellyroll fold domain-containing protein [Prosthecobacter sp.]MDI1315423.1 plastocyanin/azurin family copper-binding protein [Prosthecobacter sp.]